MQQTTFRAAQFAPQKLTEEQVANPMSVIQHFFSFGHLPEIRLMLWEIIKTTVTGDYCKSLSRRERSDMLYFFEQLEKLVEASHLLMLKRGEEE